MSLGDDKVPVVCPQCDKRLMVPAGTIGKQGRCPACKNVFTLEQLFEAEHAGATAGAYGAPPTFASNSPYADDDFKGDYQLQAAPPTPTPTVTHTDFQQMATNYSGNYQPRSSDGSGGFWNGSVLGGIALMVIACVWFFGALFLADRIFFYPPIMFIIGLVTVVKGLMSGNLAGE